MYPVAHMAAAVGGVWLGERVLNRVRGVVPSAVWRIDFRWVAVGALLPDVIDKPLARAGIDALSYDQTAGHSIGHTLLVSLAVLAAGSLLASRGEARLLWLGLGCATHLLVDPVVAYPGVLLWPLFGFDFPESKGIPSWPYLIGFDALLVASGIVAYRTRAEIRNRVRSFMPRGEVDEDVTAGGRGMSVAREV